MIIEVDSESIIPVYEQIVNQVQHGVLAGDLADRTPLPSIRQLAADLQLNHNTVAKAYQMLEMNGVIESHGRKGSFVTPNSKEQIQVNIKRSAKLQIAKLLHSLKDSGLRRVEIEKLINDGLVNVFELKERK